MAMSGKFAADFSDFVIGGQKAEAALRALEGTGGSLARAVDRNFTTIGTASTRTTNAFATMRDGLSQVDRTLAQFGVNLTPQVAVLGELAQVSGKTAAQLGLLGSAGLVAATGMAAWETGRWIAGITGTDAAVTKLTTSLLGLGDVAAETTGAKVDSVTLALQRGAPAMTTYTEAIQFNDEWVKKHAASLLSSEGRIREWHNEIAQLGARGRLKELRADLEGNALTLQELAAKYEISTGAIQNWSRETKASTESAAAATKKFHDARKKQLEDEQAAQERTRKAQEEIDRAYRALQNQLAEEHLQLEGARLQKEQDAHAAMIAAKIKAEEQFFTVQLHGGLLITGAPRPAGAGELERPQSLLRPQPLAQRGVTIFTDEGAPAVDYGGYTPSPYVPRLTAGTVTNITNVDARNSFYTRPSDTQALADTISRTLGSRLTSQGRSF